MCNNVSSIFGKVIMAVMALSSIALVGCSIQLSIVSRSLGTLQSESERAVLRDQERRDSILNAANEQLVNATKYYNLWRY